MSDTEKSGGRTTPPAPDPRPGKNPGYAEPQPRDKQDAQRPDPPKPVHPDTGGMERDADADPDTAGSD